MIHKKIKLFNAKCTSLVMEAPVNFDAGTFAETADFEIEAYTGQVVDRWWGKLAIEVGGITASQKMPILRDHKTSDIVGHSMKSWSDGSFMVSGKFSKSTETAKEVQSLAEEGFPWQASIGVKPRTVVEIKSGTSMNVNGNAVPGPAEIWVESEVYETSFVPLGADGNTSVSMLAKIEEVVQGAEKTQRNDSMNNLSLEEMCKKTWNSDASIRYEFVDDFEAFFAYETGIASGKLRISGNDGESHSSIYQGEKNMKKNETLAKAAQREWDSDASLHYEFQDNFDAYLWWKKVEATGKVRISGNAGRR